MGKCKNRERRKWLDDGNYYCECCDKPVEAKDVDFDSEGVPLCKECYQQLCDEPEAYPAEPTNA